MSQETFVPVSATAVTLEVPDSAVIAVGPGLDDTIVGVDAFASVPYSPFHWTNAFKTILGLLVMFPVRLVLFLPVFFLHWILARLVCLGHSFPSDPFGESKPLSAFRRSCIRFIGRIVGRVCLWCYGFYWISVTRRKSLDVDSDVARKKRSPPAIIVSNHVSYMDIVYHVSAGCPGFVSKVGVRDVPMVGFIATTYQSMYIDRTDSTVGAQLKDRILKRVTGNDSELYPPLLFFPEGTTTNGSGMIQFRQGAFIPGVPVQPVVLKYKYKSLDTCYGTIPILKHIVFMLTQFWNTLEVVYLPPYYPSAEEQADARLYAGNVRKIMLDELHGRDLQYTVADKFKFMTGWEAKYGH